MNSFFRTNSHTLLLIILLIGFGLRVRLSQDRYVHKWDERFHALVSKNLINHPLKPTLYETPLLKYDYKNWYSSHIWMHKQPLPLWLIAGSYSLFGVSDFATRIPSLIFSLLAIFITYLLGKDFFSKKIGLLSAFFIAINGLIIEIGAGRIATDHYDILFLCFIELGILFAYYGSKRKSILLTILSGIFVGLAILTKWLPAFIVFPIHLVFLFQEKFKKREITRFLSFSIMACLLIALPWQIYILKNFPLESKWEYFHQWLHLSTQLEGQPDDGWFHYLTNIRIKYSEVIYIPLVFLIYKLIKSKFKNFTMLALFIWIFIPILFFSFAKTKMTGYILFVSPALFIVTACFFFELKDNLIYTFSNKAFRFLSWILLISMIALPIRYCYERTSFGLEKPRSESYCENYKKFRETLTNKSLVLNVSYPIEFMFYNGGIAYSTDKIENSDYNRIISLGYKVFKLDTINNNLKEVSF